jgi:hypothetical protein
MIGTAAHCGHTRMQSKMRQYTGLERKRTNDGGLSIGLTGRTEVEIRKEQVTATMEMDVIILMGA